MVSVSSLGKFFEKFGLAAFISPVSVADKTKSDDFDLWPDLDLKCVLLTLASGGGLVQFPRIEIF